MEVFEIFIDGEVDNESMAALGKMISPSKHTAGQRKVDVPLIGSAITELSLESLIQTITNSAWDEEYGDASDFIHGTDRRTDTML